MIHENTRFLLVGAGSKPAHVRSALANHPPQDIEEPLNVLFGVV